MAETFKKNQNNTTKQTAQETNHQQNQFSVYYKCKYCFSLNVFI